MSAPCIVSLQKYSQPHEVLDRKCRRLWLNGQYVQREPSHSFFDVPGEDLLLMDYGGLWLASHSDAALGLLRSGLQYRRPR